MTTSELFSHGMSLDQNVVGSTNVGALPLLSKIGKVRVLCLQFLPLQIVLSLQYLLSTVVGQFGTGQFGTGQFGTRTIWHQDNLTPDSLVPGEFGTRAIWHQDNLAPGHLINQTI